jgi:5-methylcytosine-specific restriction endonuclease McrA
MEPRYRDEVWLRERYWGDGMTQREIAEECDVSARTIGKYMSEFGIETREIEGENHPMYGTQRTEEVKEKISSTLQGRELSDEWRAKIAEGHRGRTLSEEVRSRISKALAGRTLSEETRRKMSKSTAGERNPNWRGGYSRYYGAKWGIVRDRIRERDEVCQHCGHDGSEYRLEVHHITPVRLFRESDDHDVIEAHNPDNLVLLCNRCHGKADHGLLGLETGTAAPSPRESADDN